MPKVLLIAQGEYIAHHARHIRAQMADPANLEIVVAHMEEAVRVAQSYVGTDVEVIIARSISARMIRRSVPIPVVEIPISNEEILRSIHRAQELAEPGTPIGFLGFTQAVSAIQPFLNILNYKINIYEVTSSSQNIRQIEQAKDDGVTVLIGGARSVDLITRSGLKAVLMDTSLNSIAIAYRQAGEILKARAIEKKMARENAAILDSVSDAIISLDLDGKVTMINRRAAETVGGSAASLTGRHFGQFFRAAEQPAIRNALRTGEETIGDIVERHGAKYAMRVVPIVVDSKTEGVIVTMQEIHALQRMEATVRKGLYRKGHVAQYFFDDIKGESDSIRDTIATARNFAALQSNILIIGETGTGKELLAQSIHNAGPRREGPFVAVNCGAIPPNLIESELFGHEEGAFTGSRKGGRMGLFEIAHNGTIFLDEISEMDQAGQINLLRALQERQFRRVGGTNVIPVDVRVIAASNANLMAMVRENRFRRDLYYRLSVLVLKLPPLRQRYGDIAILASYFVDQYSREFGKSLTLSSDALQTLEDMAWEGNVRQLRNFCERLAAVAVTPVADSHFVRKQLADTLWESEDSHNDGGVTDDMIIIKGRVYVKADLEELIQRHDGNRAELARKLGVSRTTLWKYIRNLGA